MAVKKINKKENAKQADMKEMLDLHAASEVKITEDEVRDKIRQTMKIMGEHSVGQQDLIECMILATLSNEHAVFIGPHGCNKTGNIDMMTHLLGANDRHALMHNGRKHSQEELSAKSFTFFITMDKYTTPDALFGPYSMSGLKEDRWVRNLNGTLAEADFAYVGEIFSANGATLRSMVRALNEREVENGGERFKLRLRSLFADSNFESMENTAAVYDRFLFRMPVQYLDRGKKSLFIGLMDAQPFDKEATKPLLDLQALDVAREGVQAITMRNDIVDSLYELNNKIIAECKITTLSDRRWRRSVGALKASAWLRGDTIVQLADFYLALRFILFDRMQHYEKVVQLLEPYKQMIVSENESNAVEECARVLDAALKSTKLQDVVSANFEINRVMIRVNDSVLKTKLQSMIDLLEDKMLGLEGEVKFGEEDIF